MSANVSYVGKPCPKCRHVRTAADGGPDWQCPRCGIAYAKFGQPVPAPAAPTGAARGAAPGPAPTAAAKADGTGLAMFAHLSIILGGIIPFLGIIAPVVIWITKRGENELAVSCAKEAINFQISMLLWALLLVGVGLLSFVVAPAIYLAGLFAVVMVLACFILPIIGTMKASGGESYSYPYTAHIFS